MGRVTQLSQGENVFLDGRGVHALRLLQSGPCYEQIAIKTERAAAQLCWLEARVLPSEELAAFRKAVEEEETAYQAALAAAMEGM